MHILAFILMLVVGSIVAASNGDFSGLIGIGKNCGRYNICLCTYVAVTSPGFTGNCNFYFNYVC